MNSAQLLHCLSPLGFSWYCIEALDAFWASASLVPITVPMNVVLASNAPPLMIKRRLVLLASKRCPSGSRHKRPPLQALQKRPSREAQPQSRSRAVQPKSQTVQSQKPSVVAKRSDASRHANHRSGAEQREVAPKMLTKSCNARVGSANADKELQRVRINVQARTHRYVWAEGAQ